MENVLVIGATGNVGVAAEPGLCRQNVQTCGNKERHHNRRDRYHVGRRSANRGGPSPGWETARVSHVYSAGKTVIYLVYPLLTVNEDGGAYGALPLTELSLIELRQIMSVNFESNFFAYRPTIPFLLEQKMTTSFTPCTGAQGCIGARAAPAISQGPLFSMANVACRDNTNTSVRFSEVYLNCRVEVDSSAALMGAMKSSEFARAYTELRFRPEINNSRIIISTHDDLKDPMHKKKIAQGNF
ncbi:hypothetical protein EAE96_009508 [Botrytis aclada]|nr:hypothetical protein EAE96_009508 [Botrytis aclada]